MKISGLKAALKRGTMEKAIAAALPCQVLDAPTELKCLRRTVITTNIEAEIYSLTAVRNS